MNNTVIGLFDSSSYNDIRDLGLCQSHHAQLRYVLDLPRWDGEHVELCWCECCEDPDMLDVYMQQSAANELAS